MGQVVSFAERALRESFVDGFPVGCDMPWYLPRQEAELCVGAECYRDRRTLTLDFETTNLDKGDPLNPRNRIVYTVSKRGTSPARRVDLAGLKADLEWAEVLVAQNAKFELGWLMRENLPWEHLLVWDTMIAEKVKLGNNPERLGLGLDALCKRYGLVTKDPLIDALMRGGVCPSEQPEHLLSERCLRDVETTHEIFRKQHDSFTAKKRNVVFTRCIFTPVLAAIEREGMYLDPEAVRAEYTAVERRLSELEGELRELAAGRNLQSPKQLAEVLYEILKFPAPKRYGKPILTKQGVPPTNRETIAGLRAKTKKQKRFLELQKEYSKMKARMTKVLRFFMASVNEHGGHFYGQFHQTRTQTHRTSSTARPTYFKSLDTTLGVQLQNLPREYKKLFRSPHPDYYVVEPDGSQLEFRVGGELGRDAQVQLDVENGEDIHLFSASALFNKPQEAITSKERTAAKPETFKPLYGGQKGTDAQMAYYKAFRKKYHGVYSTQMGWVAEVLKTGRLEMPWGMTFYFPKAKMNADGYCPDTPSIFNYPVQCLATAEIIPISLTYLYWYGRLNGLAAKLINTVHDSGVALVRRDQIDQYRSICKKAFFDSTYRYLDKVYGIKMKMPLGLGFKAGERWGEGEEQKFQEHYREAA